LKPADLTIPQWDAVDHYLGPLLVLAGPGSGKTRVITRRIARLVERGVPPWQILAITFTNKAANEMAARVEKLLPGTRVWVSTFHRLCDNLLRRHAAAVGLQPNFTILDTTDQTQLLRDVLTELDVDSKHFPPGRLLHRIGQAKNRMLTAEQFLQESEQSGGMHDQLVARVYTKYEAALLKSNAVDFDDLLLHVCRLLAENEEVRSALDQRYQFVLVDEYQDTNLAQYQIVNALSRDYPNLCATGDPDQSIYGWRGAEIGNILRFEHDYSDAKVVRLEQNYRSTQSILAAADQLIAHNVRRKAKRLFTENDVGTPPELLACLDQSHEADCIAQTISHLAREEQRDWSDFAIFYRINALSRGIELALSRLRIPYQVAAGVAFYERAEIKDVLAYLRLIHNPSDQTAFTRVVNSPTRGIGKTTVGKLAGWAAREGISLLDTARRAHEFPGLTKKPVAALRRFAALIDELSRETFPNVTSLIDAVLLRTGYLEQFSDSKSESDMQRKANVEELKTAAKQYDELHADGPTLEGFLETTSLVADLDSLDDRAGAVTLMTLHAAKGLEFPVVFIAAVEQGLLPHERALRDGSRNEVEEERRLLFVGVTRAEERLFLTQTQVRAFRGNVMPTVPSDFLREMELKRTSAAYIDSDIGLPPPFRADDEQTDDSQFEDDAEPSRPADRSATESSNGTGSDRSPQTRVVHRAQAGNLPKITTAAQLLSGAGAIADQPLPFAVGMSVRHPQLGVGTVVEAQGAGIWGTVTVEFDEGSSRSFVIHKCPLQPVG
jgi:DNA helicase II / ATP-dependent DNA helicase PcrA